MYTTFFYCRAKDDLEREERQQFIEATLLPLFPPDSDAVVEVAPGDPNHVRVVVTWGSRRECEEFLESNEYAEWRDEAKSRDIRLQGPLSLERAA